MARIHTRPPGERADAHPRSIGGGHTCGEELYVPELEDAMRAVPPCRPWTERELAALRRYYRPGMLGALVEYYAKAFPPGRSLAAIEHQARRHGIAGKRG